MPPHFTSKTLTFLKQLATHNDRDWFAAHKPAYDQHCKAPLLALIEAITPHLPPPFHRDSAKCAMRIYRDIRFSKNKLPYKTNLAAWWAHAGMEKTSAAGFYFELNATQVTIAAGCYMPEKDQLHKIRTMLLTRHQDFRHALASSAMDPFDGLRMTRGPKGFPADSPAADLILQRQWGVGAHLPAETALTPALLDHILTRFHAATPLVDLLNQPLVGTRTRPLF